MPQPKPLPPVALLRELFEYDPETGQLTYRMRPKRSRVVVGSTAGNPTPNGYLQVQVKNRRLLAHRVCWKIHTGHEPPVVLDHVNGNRKDNSIKNLRASTAKKNQGNRKSTGQYLPGAWPKYNRWQANTPGHYIGMFNTEEEAHQAYVRWHLSYFGEHSIYARDELSS